MFLVRISDCWLALGLWCTQSPGCFPAALVLPWDAEHQEPLGRNPELPVKGKVAVHSHRPWGVNYCFSSSPFTLCILKLLSLPISSHTADSSILLGASSGPLQPLLCSFWGRWWGKGTRISLLMEYFLARLSLILSVTCSIFPKATFWNTFNKEEAGSEYSDTRPCMTKTSISVHN